MYFWTKSFGKHQVTNFFEFGYPKVTVHKYAETIQGRKQFKGGNYMRRYGTYLDKF